MLWCCGPVVWTVVVVVVSKELSEVRYDGQDRGGATTTTQPAVSDHQLELNLGHCWTEGLS